MAKFKGLFQFIGTLAGITAVNSKEGLYLKKANAIPKSRYKNAPEYADFKMNGLYMATSAKLSSNFRQVLGTFVIDASNTRMYSRMNALMRNLIMCDQISEKGNFKASNGITTTKGKQIFENFWFNKTISFESVFYGVYQLDTILGTVTLLNFDPSSHLQIPIGATHCGIQSGIMRFDFESQKGFFKYSNPTITSLSALPSSITLFSDFPTGSGGTLLYFLKILFYQKVNDELYALKGNGCAVVKIVGVY